MRLAIAGKGGTGKTTLAGTLARVLAREGARVVAFDGDSAPNLALALGLGADALDGLPTLPGDGRGLVALRRTHAVRAPDGVELLVMARAEAAGTGCLSGRHAAVRELLGQVPADEVGVLDMEPTPEAFSRSVARHADVLLVLAEPTPPSLLAARRVVGLARDLGLRRIELVAGKVRDERDAALVRAAAAELGVELAGVVPLDPAVAEAERAGLAPLDAAPRSPAVAAMSALARRYVRQTPTLGASVAP